MKGNDAEGEYEFLTREKEADEVKLIVTDTESLEDEDTQEIDF